MTTSAAAVTQALRDVTASFLHGPRLRGRRDRRGTDSPRPQPPAGPAAAGNTLLPTALRAPVGGLRQLSARSSPSSQLPLILPRSPPPSAPCSPGALWTLQPAKPPNQQRDCASTAPPPSYPRQPTPQPRAPRRRGIRSFIVGRMGTTGYGSRARAPMLRAHNRCFLTSDPLGGGG